MCMHISKWQMLKETLCFWKREYLVYKMLKIENGQIVTPYQKMPVTSSLLVADGELIIGEDWGVKAAFGGIIHTLGFESRPEVKAFYEKDSIYFVKAYGLKKDLRGITSAKSELGFTKIRIDEKDLFELQELAKVKQ